MAKAKKHQRGGIKASAAAAGHVISWRKQRSSAQWHQLSIKYQQWQQ